MKETGIVVADGIVPSGAKTPTHYDTKGQGGSISVRDLDQRDDIPVGDELDTDGLGSGRRKAGMTVFVIEEGKEYRLVPEGFLLMDDAARFAALADNGNWVEIDGGSGSAVVSPADRTFIDDGSDPGAYPGNLFTLDPDPGLSPEYDSSRVSAGFYDMVAIGTPGLYFASIDPAQEYDYTRNGQELYFLVQNSDPMFYASARLLIGSAEYYEKVFDDFISYNPTKSVFAQELPEAFQRSAVNRLKWAGTPGNKGSLDLTSAHVTIGDLTVAGVPNIPVYDQQLQFQAQRIVNAENRVAATEGNIVTINERLDGLGDGDAEFDIPLWDTTKEYAAGNIVQHLNAIWKAQAATPANHAPNTGSTLWKMMGPTRLTLWNPDVTYQGGDLVIYNSKLWECYDDNVLNVTPGTSWKWWQLLDTAKATQTGFLTGMDIHLEGDSLSFQLYKDNQKDQYIGITGLKQILTQPWTFGQFCGPGVAVTYKGKLYVCLEGHMATDMALAPDVKPTYWYLLDLSGYASPGGDSGAGVTIEQTLNSNSPNAVPSVAAVSAELAWRYVGASSLNNIAVGAHSDTSLSPDSTNNRLGASYQLNFFGTGYTHNTFGNSYQKNNFGSNYEANTFGNKFQQCTFGNSYSYNNFGNDFYSVTGGDNVVHCTIGNGAKHLRMGGNNYRVEVYNCEGDSMTQEPFVIPEFACDCVYRNNKLEKRYDRSITLDFPAAPDSYEYFESRASYRYQVKDYGTYYIKSMENVAQYQADFNVGYGTHAPISFPYFFDKLYSLVFSVKLIDKTLPAKIILTNTPPTTDVAQ